MAHVFISYSRKDEAFARRLAADLDRLGGDAWIDRDDIRSGEKWSTAIQQGLDESLVMIVVLSPAAMASTNVEDEWQYFLDQDKPLLPVLLSPAKVHFQLSRLQYIDFHSQPYETAFRQLYGELVRHGVPLLTLPEGGAGEAVPPQKPLVARRERLPRSALAMGLAAGLVGLIAIVAIVVLLLSGDDGRRESPFSETPNGTGGAVTLMPSATWLPAGSSNGGWQPVTADHDGIPVVYVPGGCFTMGRSDGPADERPAHDVCLDAFWIGQTEVTNAQYAACVDAGACTPSAETEYYEDPDHADFPVIGVTWDQAHAYAEWVGGRLPTEAEWEYAARGPEGRAFPWGSTFDGSQANACGAECDLSGHDSSFNDRSSEQAPADSYHAGASWVGALNLSGNVWEWVADYYGPYPTGAQTQPVGPASGDLRVGRGASWFDGRDSLRATVRGNAAPDYQDNGLGLRVAFDHTP